jgi:hypothetical protein
MGKNNTALGKCGDIYYMFKKKELPMKSSCGIIAVFLTTLLLLMRPAPAAEYSGGGRIGLNVSSIFGDSVQNLTSRVGFNFELYATEWLNPRLGLQQELVIDMRGGHWTSDPTESMTTVMAYNNYATNFTYLAIPLLVKWRFMNNDAVRPSLYLGPTLAFPLITEAEYNGNTRDMGPNTNKFDFDVTAGLSLDIRKGNVFIPVDIRYTYGLTNFAKTGEYNAHVKHGVFSISAGLGHIVEFKKNKEKEL